MVGGIRSRHHDLRDRRSTQHCFRTCRGASRLCSRPRAPAMRPSISSSGISPGPILLRWRGGRRWSRGLANRWKSRGDTVARRDRAGSGRKPRTTGASPRSRPNQRSGARCREDHARPRGLDSCSRLVAALLALLPDEVDRELVDTCARLAEQDTRNDLVHGALSFPRILSAVTRTRRSTSGGVARRTRPRRSRCWRSSSATARALFQPSRQALDSAASARAGPPTTHLCRSKSDVDF